MSLLSHVGDGVGVVTLFVAHCQCCVMLVMVLLRRLGHGTMSAPSHAGDGIAKVTLAMA
jgi:hypothetical protein